MEGEHSFICLLDLDWVAEDLSHLSLEIFQQGTGQTPESTVSGSPCMFLNFHHLARGGGHIGLPRERRGASRCLSWWRMVGVGQQELQASQGLGHLGHLGGKGLQDLDFLSQQGAFGWRWLGGVHLYLPSPCWPDCTIKGQQRDSGADIVHGTKGFISTREQENEQLIWAEQSRLG